MKTYSSTMIKKSKLPSDVVLALEQDIEKFNVLLRKAVKEMGLPVVPGTKSLHVRFKETYSCSDYFVSSVEAAAKGVRKSAEDALKRNLETQKGRIAQMESRIQDIEKQLANMYKIKNSLKARSQARQAKRPLPSFENYFGSGIVPQGDATKELSFLRPFKGRKKRPPVCYDNEYLLETLYVDPYIRRKKHNIRQIKGRIHNTRRKVESLSRRLEEKDIRVCYGGRKLFRQQAGASPDKAHPSFGRKRRREMLLTGRSDATQGNFMVRYNTKTQAWSYTTTSKEEVVLPGVCFPHGQDIVDVAVDSSVNRKENKKLAPGEKALPCWQERIPVTWSVLDRGNAFQVKCMVTPPEPPMNTCYDDGCVAFDMNYEHLAVAEVNQYGQKLNTFVVPFKMRGRTSGQVDNALSEALEVVFKYAQSVKKPIGMERIKDLRKELMYGNAGRNRKISSFAYDKMQELAESKSGKYGIAVKAVNPAFTSQIGKLKYMGRLGLSIHEAAAVVIARRAMGYKERVPKKMRHLVPKGRRGKHHWSQWRAISSKLKDVPIDKFYRRISYPDYKNLSALKKALTA